jgi:DMSO/TMAO reductase YedYZ molybdopterin-dependent catalytic subunit
MQCVSNEVGGYLVGNAVWQGVPLRDLLDRAGVQEAGEQVVGVSVDGFTAGFPRQLLVDDRTALVAYAMNGELLPARNGFPARLVVAGLYGYVSATKWLRTIELTRLDEVDGFWIPRGWSKDGPIKTTSRIDVPRAGQPLRVGTVAVAGVAWAPTRGISKVEVRVDEGDWQEAELGGATSDETWVQWRFAWDAPAGQHVLEVRATDGAGEVQTEAIAPPAPNGATGLHRRRVAVA